jgi:hypothetical protein
LACLGALAAFLLAPVRLLMAAAEQPADAQILPTAQPFRAIVNDEMFNLHQLGQIEHSDLYWRQWLGVSAAHKFGQPGWRKLRFVTRSRCGAAVIPSYVWA